MGRRQGRTPPYEIMQHVGSGTPLPRSGVRKVRGGSVGLLGLAWGGIKAAGGVVGGIGRSLSEGRLWAGLAERCRGLTSGGGAVEVRLPWPVLALLGVVGLAAMGLMFQIGQHVAGRSAPAPGSGGGAVATQIDENKAVNQPLAIDSTPGGDTASVEDQTGTDGTVVAMDTQPARVEPIQPLGGGNVEDPRQPGLNYFVLATVRPSEVDGVWGLQQFLAQRGVATFLDNSNNGRFRVLVDVTRGFTREELRNLEHAEHDQTIRALGREWKISQGGIGTDLSKIYLDRFDGPSPMKSSTEQ